MAKSRDCCFEPGIARPVRKMVTSAAQLLVKGPIVDVIEATLKNTPSANAQSEDRFARQSAQKFMSHGHPTTHFTAATRHVLNEVQTMHHLALERFHSDLPTTTEVVREQNSRSGWNVFVIENAATNTDLKALGAEWHRLPQSEQAKYNAKAVRPEAAPPDAAAQAAPPLHTGVAHHTPLQIGDLHYPMRATFVEKATASVKSGHRSWQKMVGGLISRDPDLTVKNVDIKQCCDMYGSGICFHDWTEDVHTAFARHKRVLWALARMNRTMNADLDDVLFFSLEEGVGFFRQSETLSL